ncbi:MAG: hypothetical protein FD189_1054 [Elusimicrobia bacterium]|nr:MAG: hypothetical protein FD189_1054 [Elusimicrobiota bacterium]
MSIRKSCVHCGKEIVLVDMAEGGYRPVEAETQYLRLNQEGLDFGISERLGKTLRGTFVKPQAGCVIVHKPHTCIPVSAERGVGDERDGT